jgi:trigger factor
MQNSAETTNALERRLDLSVSIAEIDAGTEQRLKQMGRNIKMSGFRPGKVPVSVVRQQYGEQARHEVLTDALNSAFSSAISGQKLRVAGYPRIEPKTSESATHLEFSAIFEVYPEFVPGDVSTAHVDRLVLDVSDAEIDKTIDILRRQRVEYSDVARAAAKDDRVVIDFLGKKDGEPFPGGQASDYPFVLGQNMMLPAFEAAVEGLSAGDAKTFDMTFPEDYFAKELAGQAVQFEVTVKAVQGADLPPVDAAFAQSLGVADGDIVKMRAEIESNLKREVKKRIDARTKESVMEALIQVNPIEVPNALIELEIERLMEKARQDMAGRGMKAKDFPIQPAWFADQAKRRVMLGLILAEVVRTEQLKAKPEQVRAMIEEAAQSYEHPEEVVRWYYAEPQRLAEVEAMAIESNVVEWVLGKARVIDKQAVFDELMGQQG